MFGDKDTLVIYSFMYGPQRKNGCPICTSQMGAWDGIAPHVKWRAAFVMTARSPIERILAFGKKRGWENLHFYSDSSGDYTRDDVSAEGADLPGYNVFTRKDGVIPTSGAAKAAKKPLTLARIRTMRRTCRHCGLSWTQCPKDVQRNGIRSWMTNDALFGIFPCNSKGLQSTYLLKI